MGKYPILRSSLRRSSKNPESSNWTHLRIFNESYYQHGDFPCTAVCDALDSQAYSFPRVELVASDMPYLGCVRSGGYIFDLLRSGACGDGGLDHIRGFTKKTKTKGFKLKIPAFLRRGRKEKCNEETLRLLHYRLPFFTATLHQQLRLYARARHRLYVKDDRGS